MIYAGRLGSTSFVELCQNCATRWSLCLFYSIWVIRESYVAATATHPSDHSLWKSWLVRVVWNINKSYFMGTAHVLCTCICSFKQVSKSVGAIISILLIPLCIIIIIIIVFSSSIITISIIFLLLSLSLSLSSWEPLPLPSSQGWFYACAQPFRSICVCCLYESKWPPTIKTLISSCEI